MRHFHSKTFHFTEIEKAPSYTPSQNTKKVDTYTKAELTCKDTVDKKENTTSDEAITSTNTIFKRTALEEKLIAFSGSTDEILSESDSDGETQEKGNKNKESGVSKVTQCHTILQKNEEGGVKGSNSNASIPNVKEETSVTNGRQITEGVTSVNISKPGWKNKEKVFEKNAVLPCQNNEVTLYGNVNKQDNLEKTGSLPEQDDSPPELIKYTVSEFKSKDGDVSEQDNGINKEALEAFEEDKNNKFDNKQLHGTDKCVNKPKEDKNLNTLIEDLQKYGTGMDITVKSKKEIDKSEVKKVKREKAETSKLTDVNFFSAGVLKQNTKKTSKEAKIDGSKSKKGVKSECLKDKKTLKKKLSDSKLATTKEKSKIQRYKELKKLVTDSEKNVSADNVKNSVSVFEGVSKKTERAKEAKEFARESKKQTSTAVNLEKDSTRFPNNTDRTENVHANKVLNIKKLASVSPSKSGKKDTAGKTEQNKRFKDKNSPKETCGVSDPEKAVVISSDCKHGIGETHKLGSDVDNSLEDDSEESELLRLFNDYDPDDEESEVMESMDNYLTNNDAKDESNRLQQIPKSITGLKRPSTESAPAGFKKQRVAHQPNLVSHSS